MSIRTVALSVTLTLTLVGLGVPTVAAAKYEDNITNAEAYEAYKQAVYRTRTAKSKKAVFQLEVTDNGQQVVCIRSTVKENRERHALSKQTVFLENGKQNEVFVHRENGTETVIRSDGGTNRAHAQVITLPTAKQVNRLDDRTVNRRKAKEREGAVTRTKQSSAANFRTPQAAATFFDALVADLPGKIEHKRAPDGAQVISLALTHERMPPVAQLLLTSLMKNDGSHEPNKLPTDWLTAFSGYVQARLPQISQLRLERVHLEAHIHAERVIERQAVHVRWVGTARDGTTHTLTALFTVAYSDYNQTTPESLPTSA
ncbi:hypothetical protein [Numidum massiliense]|uniref:hypothetical protein n=1 Tax=Numidum massiliense TaxID=1522315 RepID=UPI0006D5A837|nr:hypothetical protein [Numidum massiliense]